VEEKEAARSDGGGFVMHTISTVRHFLPATNLFPKTGINVWIVPELPYRTEIYHNNNIIILPPFFFSGTSPSARGKGRGGYGRAQPRGWK